MFRGTETRRELFVHFKFILSAYYVMHVLELITCTIWSSINWIHSWDKYDLISDFKRASWYFHYIVGANFIKTDTDCIGPRLQSIINFVSLKFLPDWCLVGYKTGLFTRRFVHDMSLVCDRYDATELHMTDTQRSCRMHWFDLFAQVHQC